MADSAGTKFLWDSPKAISRRNFIKGVVAGGVAVSSASYLFAIRPEKRAITKSMIFGWMDRTFYLKHYDPQRWRIETPNSSSIGKRPEA